MVNIRALVVEDEPAARNLLVSILEGDGYKVRAVSDGREALDAAKTFEPDIALLDGGLPGMDGGEVLRHLRRTGNIPIILVTAADTAKAVHRGFELGADDYVVKPFDPEELSLRVRALLRRSGRAVAGRYECGDLVVDEATRSVVRGGAPIELTAREFKMLGVLARNRTRVVTKSQLAGQVWDYDVDDHLVEVHLSSLRRKLEAHGPRIIHTLRGTGYVLRPC